MKNFSTLIPALLIFIFCISATNSRAQCFVCNGYQILNTNSCAIDVSYEVVDVNCNTICSGILVGIAASTGVHNLPAGCCSGSEVDIFVVIVNIGGSPSTMSDSLFGCGPWPCTSGVANNLTDSDPSSPCSWTINWSSTNTLVN